MHLALIIKKFDLKKKNKSKLEDFGFQCNCAEFLTNGRGEALISIVFFKTPPLQKFLDHKTVKKSSERFPFFTQTCQKKNRPIVASRDTMEIKARPLRIH